MEGKEDKQSHDSGTVFLPPETSPALVSGEINFGGSTVAPPPPPPPPTAGSDGFKKKRGRPRKYGPDGKPAATLSPMPISASIPLTGDYTGWKQQSQEKPLTSVKRKQKLEFCSPGIGEQGVYSVGANFTPHVLTVKSGEDVNMKIISFAQKEARAICVLAANGSISNVTLGQHNSSGGTLTYEGRFDILSLSGAFVLNENGGAKGMSGGMSVSLAGPDGRVLGGGLAGMLVAAGPIQVILGSFLPNQQQEQQKPKKSRFEPVQAIGPPTIASMPIFKETSERAYNDEPNNISFTLTTPLNIENNNGPLNGPESSKVMNTSQFEVSC